MIAHERLNNIPKEKDLDIQGAIDHAHALVHDVLGGVGIDSKHISAGKVRPHSILYFVYWYNRLRSNIEEQHKVREQCKAYLGDVIDHPEQAVKKILSHEGVKSASKEYVENLLFPQKTVDLVILRDDGGTKSILTYDRPNYPAGNALPGGFVLDSDEDNPLGVSPQLFAALRVAGGKVLGVPSHLQHYEIEERESGEKCYVVYGDTKDPAVRIFESDDSGYHLKENIHNMLRPSDPRHLVDTVGFKCELVGMPTGEHAWRTKSDVMSDKSATGGFSLPHHREIIAHISAQTSVEKERALREKDFIRGIIKSPLESYTSLRDRFTKEGSSPEVSFPELFPVVDRLLTNAYSQPMNDLCRQHPTLAGIRDKAAISLRHVALKNRTFCPYLPTLTAIMKMVAFYDIAARERRGFYSAMQKDGVEEHNPARTPHASYHMYRYEYRVQQLMHMVPREIIIPTFESLSATDLMRVRGVPVRFIGLSEDFLYVDEFEQSPEEFFAHDANHSWRMVMEDRAAEEKYGRTRERLLKESNVFINEYLEKIKIRKGDSEEVREIKKLKKIILFEIVHEDARPFLKDVICSAIQIKEGGAVPFEMPRIDKKTGYMDVVDTLDTGISTLSYVRNKLQHGFYDQVDAQLPQIVDPKYRTSKWIAWAAYDMLQELDATPEPCAKTDYYGLVSYQWLLDRTLSAGPDNIHTSSVADDLVATADGATTHLNPKRYQVGV